VYTLLSAVALWAVYAWRKRRWLLKMQLEQEHHEAERLKELDTLKTRLYTNITHEFRTPLTVILGMAEQLQATVQEAGRNKLAAIRRSGTALLRLVNQMLDLSKLESGAMPIQRIQGDIMPFLRYQLEAFHSLAESKGIRLEFDAEPASLVGSYDSEKVETIVTNLLSNALKFTPAGKVQLRVRHTGETLLIQVLDTGAGIKPEAIPFVFDRFYQAETAADRPAEGTGIGLALTKELVKLLGGDISVQSKAGEGTEFTVQLPFDATSPTPGKATSPTLGGGVVSNAASLKMAPQGFETTPPPYVGDVASKPVLLIVEDNTDVVFYLQSLLQNAYRINVAADGSAGLAQALEHVPDIILSDVMMPGMDGFELCKILKTDIRTSHIPIILLTAKADISSKIEGLQHGADAYLAKPFHKEELFVRLDKLLESRKRLQARYSNAGSELPTAPSPTLEDAFMQQVRSILETHLGDEDFGVSELCKALAMSRAQLYRKFQALTNQPVAHYFRDLRLHKAKSLLRDTDLHISEIAYQVGFKDPAHFTRAFAEAFGVSPREWRKG
jgi:DNA-binding response OmpR family regulator/nitrogen-specific signal transduction histidine kinase